VLVNSTGRKLVVTLVNTSTIASFAVRWDGRLVAAPGSPFPAQGPGPFGSEFRPTNPSQLFVSNAHGGEGNGTVSAFDVSFSGELSSIGSSPFANLQTAPCWVEISHDGQFLFAVNTASGSISSYAIAPSGSLTLIGSVPFGSAGAGAVDARLSPDGRTLLVNGSKANVIASFAVNGGNLTELSSSPTPLPAGAVASGIVVD
jgi:6-phosphogluconolactonase (cycloisomerase 2 family)